MGEKIFMRGLKGDVIEVASTPAEITKYMVLGYVQCAAPDRAANDESGEKE